MLVFDSLADTDLTTRVFNYAKHWDFLMMAGAALASIGAGVVRCSSQRSTLMWANTFGRGMNEP